MKKYLHFLMLLNVLPCFSQGTWLQKADFGGNPRGNAVGFSLGTKGYIVTGDESCYKDLWEWDQMTNIWTQKANLPSKGRVGAVGFSIGTKGYIGTGRDSSGAFLQDFWEWDQATNLWTQKANFGGAARAYAIGFSIGTKGYIGSGQGIQPRYRDFWEWNQANNIWTQKANLGGAGRQYPVGFSIEAKGYFGTGIDSLSHMKNDFWEYDTINNIWTQKANYGGQPVSAVGFSIGNKGYIGTGVSNLNQFWEYNPQNNTWIQKANFGGTGRAGAVGFSLGNKGYIGTGDDGGLIDNIDFWEYIPDSIEGVNELLNKNIAILGEPQPNPNKNSTTIDYTLPEGINQGEIVFYNLQGAEVKRFKVDRTFSNLLISTSDIAAGTYYYQLQTNKENSGGRKMVVIR